MFLDPNSRKKGTCSSCKARRTRSSSRRSKTRSFTLCPPPRETSWRTRARFSFSTHRKFCPTKSRKNKRCVARVFDTFGNCEKKFFLVDTWMILCMFSCSVVFEPRIFYFADRWRYGAKDSWVTWGVSTNRKALLDIVLQHHGPAEHWPDVSIFVVLVCQSLCQLHSRQVNRRLSLLRCDA